jgi:lipopolysaccharide biosynthesis protein
MCRAEGIGEIYLAFTESFEFAVNPPEPRTLGFDASVEFPPHGMGAPIPPPGVISNPKYSGTNHDYRQVVRNCLKQELPGHVRFRTVMPSWDNTPRRQNDPVLFENASPGAYQAWLEAVMDLTHEQNFGEERIVFINAWNEWGEGNHLEPDRRNGHAYLEATLNAAQASLLNRAGDR